MLPPRPSECIQCSNILSLIAKIDCKLAELAKAEYNNIIFGLNKCTQDSQIGDLLNYKRILTYKAANENYACEFTVNMIASKIALYSLNDCPCNEYGSGTGGGTVTATPTTTAYVPPAPTTTTTSSSTSTTTTTTTINPCACITFTNLRNISTYVQWDVCPGTMSIGATTIPGGIGTTVKVCGSNPRVDTPGAASWTIGTDCDQSQSFPACSACKCHEISIELSKGGGSCIAEYYNCYGEFISEELFPGVYNRCIQEGSLNINCTNASSSFTVGSSCTSNYDCIPCHCYEVTPDVGTCTVERTACDGSFESSSVSVGTGLVKFCAQVGSVNIIPLAPGDSATVVDTNNDCTVSGDCK